MPHPIFTTDALIMNIMPEGEESVIAECLTRDLGRIYVHIQGAKKHANKHRMMIVPYASIVLDCVQGRAYYRCTGIAERNPTYRFLKLLTKDRKMLIRQSFSMIQRLVPAGIAIPEVFAAFDAYMVQMLTGDLDVEQSSILTLVVQLRILGILGYWNSDWTDDVLQLDGKTFEYVVSNRKSVVKLIERILVDTQMHVKEAVSN